MRMSINFCNKSGDLVAFSMDNNKSSFVSFNQIQTCNNPIQKNAGTPGEHDETNVKRWINWIQKSSDRSYAHLGIDKGP